MPVLSAIKGRRKARAGLTFVELVICVFIMGILAAVGSKKFATALHRSTVDMAANRVRTDLEYARRCAIAKSAPLIVDFDVAADAYTIAGLASLDHPGQPYSVTVSAPPYNAALAGADLGGDPHITFDRFGKPDSGGIVTVTSGGYQKVVSIDSATGKATIP